MFYAFVISSYIFHAPIGFGLESRLGFDPNSYTISFILAGVFTILYAWFVRKIGSTNGEQILKNELK